MAKNKHRTTAEIIADKKLEKRQNKYAEIIKELKYSEEVAEDIDLTGKVVRIKHDDYDKRISNGEMSKKFIKWYNENKDNEFVVADRIRDSFFSQYRLKNVEDWDFIGTDLELVE